MPINFPNSPTIGDIHSEAGISWIYKGNNIWDKYIVSVSSSIEYVSESYLNPLGQIEVKDYDNNVAVTYVNGRLTFIFGSPQVPSITAFSFNGTFDTDRFNQVSDTYSATATWSNGGYTLISASIFESGIPLTGSNAGTSLVYTTTTTGNHTYVLHVTASNPSDSSLLTISQSLTGTLSKSNPGNPTVSTTPDLLLGASSNQIEQGATGSIVFSSAYGASNSWQQVSLQTTASYDGASPVSVSPFYVTASATGSNSIVISATASYQSPVGDNSPQLNSTRFGTATYTKIRSIRAGADAATSFTQSELENISAWDTTIGGTIGTITKGTTNPSGASVTITWTGDKYHYIVYDSSRSNLTNITSAGFSVLSSFTLTTVGQYKVYRSNTLQSGYAGTTITYSLT